ncbi:hypothetical protein WHR41_00350 [Cladosporium halotolerans]|uniref:DUF7165 domain-containing protein n=1 Tax=Cladosporium halotolerans TaxID=1052096 RepID=A0AB34L1E1_9PEZI
MPVSTFSHGSAALRTESARSEIVSRWQSTRERILIDERRVRECEIQEMDGTGLHERGDWPMRPPSTSPPIEGNNGQEIAAGMQWCEGSHHITDVTAEREPEVQWVVEQDESEEHRRLQALSGNGVTERGRATLMPVREEEESHPPRESRLKGQDSATSVATSDVGETALIDRQQEQQRNREQAGSRLSVDEYMQRHSSSPSPSPSDISNDNYQSSPFGQSIPAAASELGQTNGNPADRLTPDNSQRTSPVFNGSNAPSTLHIRQNSIAKSSPLEGNSRASSACNTYPALQTTQNKDRIRYSWQSSQDDEPNRPRINVIKLVSNTVTSSAGFPQGEAFGFSTSPRGRRIAVFNSARLYILQTAALPVGISQDYALKRRPLAVEVLDDGTCLAILADPHTVNVYDLSHHRLRRSKTIKLDFPTSCIALAPTGGLIAAAYDGGVEIFSLDPAALPTDRRAVRSQRMDRLSFSQDGSTLLGTTTRINASSSVVVNVPVFPTSPDGVPTSGELKEAWCSELLHPENIRNSSHATFMRDNKTTCNDRLFAWNGIADTFGLLDTNDLQYGRVDFPIVVSPPLSTCGGLGAAIHSCPTVDEQGDTVAMIVNDRTIRLYIVPHKAAESDVSIEAHSIDHELDEGYGCPFSEVRWVYSEAGQSTSLGNHAHVQGRLLVTSPGSFGDAGSPEEFTQDVEAGRIILFDFDPQFAGRAGQTFSLTLGKSPPQMLEEPQIDVADEVALVRRRTVNQSKGSILSQRPVTLGRAATTFNSTRNGLRSASPALLRRPSSFSSGPASHPDAARSLPDLMETNEANDARAAMEEPFSNTAPRSQASLQRAASNAQRHRFQALEERVHERMSIDSTNAFFPLPEYTEEPNAPLPSRFRVMAGLDAPVRSTPKPAVVTRQNAGHAPGPASAPVSENFSADRAFASAMAPSRNSYETNRSFYAGHMPRGLQRAYSNAASRVGAGPVPRLIGDWENVSPVIPPAHRGFPPTSTDAITQSNSSRVSQEEQDYTVASGQNGRYRYSTSLLNPPGHQQPDRSLESVPFYDALRATPTLPPQQFTNFATNRRLPPHIQAFREAAAAQGSSSLFPTTQPTDQVPHRQIEPASTVPHPVTAWHPPAPSEPAAPAPSIPRAGGRNPTNGHNRRSSQNGKMGFPSVIKARKLGLFKRKRVAGDELPPYDAGEDESHQKVVSWMAGRKQKEGGCVVM